MTIRFATPEERNGWNARILANPDGGNIFQGAEFAEQKEYGDWTSRFVVAGDVSVTVLEKRFLGIYKLWYIPKGPGVNSFESLNELLPKLKRFAQKHGVFAIKIEPELIKTDDITREFANRGFVPVRAIQPNFSTVLVDISGSPDEVLARLNQKGRHAIRRAERDGATVKRVEATHENCRKMYNLLAETAEGSFLIRPFEYYEEFWQRYAKTELGQLFFAYDGERVVAAAFAIRFGKKGTYKDGASVRERSIYGASHLLQWHVILWMKENGVEIHDLCGAPPSDKINDETHPHYGIGRFKTSFNKQVTDYVGAYDIVVHPLVYKIWRAIGERLVHKFATARGGSFY